MRLNSIRHSELQLQKLIDRGIRFHGHLGPYLIAGLRMGLLALRVLDSEGHKDISAEVHTGSQPPISCLADGIQIASGCTLGKGNIRVVNRRNPEAIFTSNGDTLKISLTPAAQAIIDNRELEPAAEALAEIPETELFTWTRQ